MRQRAEVVICGAGIAGLATAHALAVRHGIRDVVLVDERSPMTLTSDKSTEAYRNWWPGPDDAMVQFMNRSIDLLEQWAEVSGDRFLLNRRGYVYATSDLQRAAQFERDALVAELQGAGALRRHDSAASAKAYRRSAHTGYAAHPTGADLFTDRAAIRDHFPFLAPDVVAVLHARRCGWFSGQQLGMFLLDEARARGVRLLAGRVTGVGAAQGSVDAVFVATEEGTLQIDTPVFVNAAGPFAREVGQYCGADLPLFSEVHYKAAFEDTLGIVDRNTGLVILDDAQRLEWSDEEREELASDDSTRWLTEEMPAGIHLRPEGYRGSQTVLMLWDYHGAQRYAQAELPLPEDPLYPEVVLRGMVRLAPGLGAYLQRLPHMYVDGGYYTKTSENRPLIGPSGVRGAYVCAAFSGFGLMAAPAAADLLAAQITGGAVPAYGAAMLPTRYEDPGYLARLASWGSTGQL